MINKVFIDGDNLTIKDVIEVARYGAKIELKENAIERIIKSRQLVEKYVDEEKVMYGINTGFGKFSDVVISKEEIEELQENLIYADAVGAGDPFDTEIVRALMLLRVNALAKGYSGIRLEVVQTLIDMINKGVHPTVREKGSVGSSGDLCPLAHMVLVMIGEGEAEYNGQAMTGRDAMKKADIPLVKLKAKEGLALINGTCVMTAIAALAIHDAYSLIKSADIISTLTLEALEGIIDAFDLRIHQIRPHKGQIATAKNVLTICNGSKLITKQGEKRVQDAYTLRCIPQIHGASRLALDYIKEVIKTEINSATDNPLIFPEENDVLSGGNFHGQPIAIAMDTLGIAISELGNVSERRIERLVNPSLSGLPAFLTPQGGLNCGFMVAQYLAAALVSENKVLAHPASVDSIPTSANQEDHVSMGTIAARKAREIIKNVQSVLAVELLCAAQAVDFKDKRKLGKGSLASYSILRSKVDKMENDKILYKDIDKAFEIIKSGLLVKEVQKAVGELN